jgi:hypothetical protein
MQPTIISSPRHVISCKLGAYVYFVTTPRSHATYRHVPARIYVDGYRLFHMSKVLAWAEIQQIAEEHQMRSRSVLIQGKLLEVLQRRNQELLPSIGFSKLKALDVEVPSWRPRDHLAGKLVWIQVLKEVSESLKVSEAGPEERLFCLGPPREIPILYAVRRNRPSFLRQDRQGLRLGSSILRLFSEYQN